MKKFLRFSISILILCLSLSGCRQTDASAVSNVNHLVSPTTETSAGNTSAMPENQPEQKKARPKNNTSIWVCNSDGASRYHSDKSCGHLGKCKHEVVKKTVKEAEAVGLTLCSSKKCRR